MPMFLAAMSSSRSDVVTQCVCSCVLTLVSIVFQGSFKGVYSLKGVSRKSQGCFKEVSMMFRCPQLISSTHQEGMCGVPLFQDKYFCAVSPPPSPM